MWGVLGGFLPFSGPVGGLHSCCSSIGVVQQLNAQIGALQVERLSTLRYSSRRQATGAASHVAD